VSPRVDEQVAQHADRAGAQGELAGGAEANDRPAANADLHRAVRQQVPHVGGVGPGPLLALPVCPRHDRDAGQVTRDGRAHFDLRHDGTLPLE
jgi:hypothetical protein